MSVIAQYEEKNVTYTYTSPEGLVLVVTGVPAIVQEDGKGAELIRYKPAVSRVLFRYLKEAQSIFTEPTIYATSFEEASFGVSVDVQIRFAGPKVRYEDLDIQQWQEATNLLYRSYHKIGATVKETRGSKSVLYPTVKAITRGSLVFGLKAKPQVNVQPPLPFAFEGQSVAEELPPEEVQILQLLIDGHALIAGGPEPENPLLSHPQIRLATYKAVELLSPREKSDIEEIQIIPKSSVVARTETVVFTPSTYQKAKHKVAELEANPIDEKKDRRDIVIVGQIGTLNRAGRMTIVNLEVNYPEDKLYKTTAIFIDGIFEKLTDFFKAKKRVLFRGIEFRTNEKWTSEPWIKEVEEAPEDTNLIALPLAQ